ncbi:Eukaryotic peptide chain release factor GTP-binding subunit [Tulasnella sp. 403]|nr:Eukaryotic peptide chain release factor GTP-binding subunit [Tulasnella sp. 403]
MSSLSSFSPRSSASYDSDSDISSSGNVPATPSDSERNEEGAPEEDDDAGTEGRASPAPSVYSYASSVDRHLILREVHGRIFNNISEYYMLPADIQEHSRLDLQHEMLRKKMNGIFLRPDAVRRALAPRQDRTPTVLDVGAGSGSWVVDMAKMFPHAEVTGLDLAPANLSREPPLNCHFECDDVNLGLRHYRNCWDVVHVRCSAAGFENYPKFLEEVCDMLRPGGVYLTVEGDLQTYDENFEPRTAHDENDPTFCFMTKIMHAAYGAMKARNEGVDSVHFIPKWLSEMTCWEEWGEKDFYIPVGPWEEDMTDKGRYISELMRQDTIRIVTSFRPLLLSHGYFPETIDRWTQKLNEELFPEPKKKVYVKTEATPSPSVGLMSSLSPPNDSPLTPVRRPLLSMDSSLSAIRQDSALSTLASSRATSLTSATANPGASGQTVTAHPYSTPSPTTIRIPPIARPSFNAVTAPPTPARSSFDSAAATPPGRVGGSSNLGGLGPSTAGTPFSTPSSSTPNRSRPPSQTHAGGILPPASFFRPSRPNSTRLPSTFNLSTSPNKSSPIGGIGIGLPFKAQPTTPTTPTSPPHRTSALPSTFKPDNTRAGYGIMSKSSREPLLPIGDGAGTRSHLTRTKPVPDASRLATPVVPLGVRGSFEKIWRRGSSIAAPSNTRNTPLQTTPKTSDETRKSWEDDAGNDQTEKTETNVEDSNEKDLEAGPSEKDDVENRNHYVQEESDEVETPRKLSVYDIGDGAAGGGVVMEMGRISLASFRTTSSIANAKKDRTDTRGDEESQYGDGFRRLSPLRGSLALDYPHPTTNLDDTPTSKTVHSTIDHPLQESTTGATLSPNPTSAHLGPHSSPQSRHAHFAPSPTRTPKELGDASAVSVTSTSKSTSLFHRAGVPEPSYMVPVLSASTSKPLRNYEFHPSANKFFLKGHFVAGGDSPLPFIGALMLLLGIAGTWFGTTCVFWWHHGRGGQAVAAVGAYMCLLTLSSMLMTAFRDPGILPRDLDPDPPFPQSSSATTDSSPVPLPRDLRVRNGTLIFAQLKYAGELKILLDTQSLTTMLVMATAIVHVYLVSHQQYHSVAHGLRHASGSAVAAALCIVVIWPMLALTLYHVRLLLLNITTIEQVRNQAHHKLTNAPTPPNPFTIGRWYHNVAYLLCRPPGYSWVDLPGYAMHDTRKVNPGFIVRPASAASADLEEAESRDTDWR